MKHGDGSFVSLLLRSYIKHLIIKEEHLQLRS